MGAYKLLINGEMVDGDLSWMLLILPLKRNLQTVLALRRSA